MPTYEFRCPNGHEFDKFFKTISTAPAELPCSKCGEIASRQLSGGAGLHFKGSGFYLTDYGKNAHRGAASEKKADGGKAEGGVAEGGKAEGGKAEGGKTESPSTAGASKSGTKSESASPKGGGGGQSAESKPPSPPKSSKPKSE